MIRLYLLISLHPTYMYTFYDVSRILDGIIIQKTHIVHNIGEHIIQFKPLIVYFFLHF